MLRLETRPEPSPVWSWGAPALALALTVLIGCALFVMLGKDPWRGLQMFFWEPLKSSYALGELMEGCCVKGRLEGCHFVEKHSK